MKLSYSEATARERIRRVTDADSFREILPPSDRMVSPHLAELGVPAAMDDGVIIGSALLNGKKILVAAQEGGFLGGGVGEVHGATLTGLFKLADQLKPVCVLVLAESGGVRLHEANAGLIAVSEVMRALLTARGNGVPFIFLIGGSNGCFGGMGLVARCADRVIMSDIGRLAMSGPEVIESSHGVEEFDSRDKALVWRTTGGKHRFLMGDCDALVEDEAAAFRQASIQAVEELEREKQPFDLEFLEAEHAMLAERLTLFGDAKDAREIWSGAGVPDDFDIASAEAVDLQQFAGIAGRMPGKGKKP